MRICSFLPSATEILYELGLGDNLVGVTHECDFPHIATEKTVVVRSVFDASKLNSKEIDNKIVQFVKEGKDIYVIDDDKLKNANPDLIVAQGLCEVCSPHMKELDRAMSILNNKPQVIVLDPHDFDEIFDSIAQIARTVGREQKGEEVIATLKRRIEYISSRVKTINNKPRVLCIEWLDPLFTSGHWIPQMVELAGAVNGVSKKAEPSRKMEWKEIIEFDPDIIFLIPCGFDVKRTMTELWRIENVEKWKGLGAVKNREVYTTDAGWYFSRPGPRTVIGIEILAKIIHPDLFGTLKVPENSFTKIY